MMRSKLVCLLAIAMFSGASCRVALADANYGIGPRSPPDAQDVAAAAAQREAEKAVQDATQQARDANILTKQPELDPGKSKPGDMTALVLQIQALTHEFAAYDAIARQDKQSTPQLNANGGPGLPVHCKTLDQQAELAAAAAAAAGKTDAKTPPIDPGANQCVACYTNAEMELNKSRVAFERLRILAAETTKMVSLGESVLTGAGQTGGVITATMAANKIREVDNAMAGFNVAYSDKYDSLLSGLKKRLDGFSVCEAKYFNNPDWYNRFGFIYYQFMADKYKR
jgi:hypothetical protein